MSSAQNVRVSYRRIELTTSASLEPAGDGLWRLVIPTPPPVRTVVSVAGDGAPRAFAVVSVHEVAAAASRSCIVREVATAELPTKVGTERHGAGALGPAPEAASHGEPSMDPESLGSGLAVPAPVVADDSEPIDVGGEDSEAIDVGGNGGGSAATADGSARGKKRRGRQRR